MPSRVDTLDEREPIGKWLAGSVAIHLAAAAGLIVWPLIGARTRAQWGDLNGGGIGSVAVNVVSHVPLPTRSGMINPVANNTESVVPEPPPKTRTRPEVKP